MIDRFLADFFYEFKLGDIPEKNEKGVYEITLPPRAQIKITKLDPGFYLHTKLSDPPQERLEEFYMYLMRANFLGQGTGGAALGLSDDEKFLTLSLFVLYEVNYREFKEKLEDFLNFTDYWRGEIKKFKETPSFL